MQHEPVDPYRREEPPPLLVVISGPSGVGKDATIKRMKEMGYPFHFVVTATTRPRREGEIDGVDYFFASMGDFAQMIEAGELLEYAVVYGQYKGIPKQQVREAFASGKDVVLRIDVQGAATIKRLVSDAVFIFLIAESEDALIKRLMERKSETPEGLRIRAATAREEMKRLNEFDYCVVNRDCNLDQTAETIAAIITAEKARVRPRRIRL
ncbi:MAG: guanylate kinase [Chloroflexi bacterium]|jgi:guanylate kinase|nr:MAG: guanylate kinase [Chloroflexota bacterium]